MTLVNHNTNLCDDDGVVSCLRDLLWVVLPISRSVTDSHDFYQHCCYVHPFNLKTAEQEVQESLCAALTQSGGIFLNMKGEKFVE